MSEPKCMVCKRLTNHSSGKCADCRRVKCARCGTLFTPQKKTYKCATCTAIARMADKRSDMSIAMGTI